MTGHDIDPDIHRMRNADGDAARAAVLLTAPVTTLARLSGEFRRLCRAAAFGEGEAYLDALAEALAARRHRGVIGGTMPLEGARMRLLQVMDGDDAGMVLS